MKKSLKKTWWAIPLVLALIAILGVIYLNYRSPDEAPLSFRIGADPKAETIHVWDDGEHHYYVFLPSYADPRSISAVVRPDTEITVAGIPLTEATDLSPFAVGKTYPMRISGKRQNQEGQLQFLQSANVATLYINTESGSMKHIHEDQNRKETVRATLFDEDGNRTDLGMRNKLNGRGHSSWTLDKKPYLLTLSSPQSLLGMNASEKWVLLSNAYDHTNLRNKLVYDLGRKSGLAWVPDCRYVDLYLNDDYAGLYLLSEKADADETHLNIPDQGNSSVPNFLCRTEYAFRWSSLRNPVKTDWGRSVEICSPENISAFQKKQIADEIQRMENVILSEDDSLLEQCVDLDSWARKYLIDEITANIDADLASNYFYCVHSQDGPVFYAGPIWDYDQTFGLSGVRNSNPRAFYANSFYETDTQASMTPYYHALYRKDSFYETVVSLYQNEFLPLVSDYMDRAIDAQADFISDASHMNQIRWSLEDEDISGDSIKAYLRDRIGFLNEVWLDGTEYCTVQLEPAGSMLQESLFFGFMSFAVKPGEVLSDLPDGFMKDYAENTWIDLDTGAVFDYRQPITKDTVLILANQEAPERKSLITRIKQNREVLLCLICIGLAGLALIGLIWTDYRKNMQKRSKHAETVK